MSHNNQPCVGLDIDGRGSALLWMEGVSFILLCLLAVFVLLHVNSRTASSTHVARGGALSWPQILLILPEDTPGGMFISNIASNLRLAMA